MPMIMPLVSEFVSSKDWRLRYVGLISLTQVAEILPFDSIPIQQITQFLKDPHPYVRFAAIHCLGQLSTDFEDAIPNKFHKLVLPVSFF